MQSPLVVVIGVVFPCLLTWHIERVSRRVVADVMREEYRRKMAELDARIVAIEAGARPVVDSPPAV